MAGTQPGLRSAVVIRADRLDRALGHLVLLPTPKDAEDRAAYLDRLHPVERAHAATLGVARQPTWIAGRVALRLGMADLGINAPDPILATSRGAPAVGDEVVASISHKDSHAVALVYPRNPDAARHYVGVDLEGTAPRAYDISRRILTSSELTVLAALPEDKRQLAVTLRFSIKEALYKALDPFVQRFVGFHEIEVNVDPKGCVRVVAAPAGFAFLANYEMWQQHWLSTASVNCLPP